MFVKSIGLNLDTVEDRHALVKAINRQFLPALRKECGLLEANVLDMANTDIMAVLCFEGSDASSVNLSDALDRACRLQGLGIDKGRFLEREHDLISEGRAE